MCLSDVHVRTCVCAVLYSAGPRIKTKFEYLTSLLLNHRSIQVAAFISSVIG